MLNHDRLREGGDRSLQVRKQRSGCRNVLDGAGETLVLLGIVVLEADLEVDGLLELALLGLLGVLEDLLDALEEGLLRDLAGSTARKNTWG